MSTNARTSPHQGDSSRRSADPKISDKVMEKEYFRLAQQTAEKEDNKTASLPCNKVKNRYTDVLPLEATRIKLEPRANEPGSDYINANQVTDPTPASHDNSTNDNYICAQAPLQNTLTDFWRMVWEQDVCMIVVLMKLSENGKVKGHRYWPKRTKGALQFNDITVTLLKGKQFPHRTDDHSEQTIIRVLELKRGNAKRNIVQLHFKDWPDFGVPPSTEPIRNLVRIMDFYRERARAAGICGPVVIHCSAGIGRTGTYLAIVFALNAIKHLKQLEPTSSGSNSDTGTLSTQEFALNSESTSYSEDDTPAHKALGSPSPTVFETLSPVATSPQPHDTSDTAANESGSKEANAKEEKKEASTEAPQPTTSSSPPTFVAPTGPNTLTRSTDSVEYETALIVDSDEDFETDSDDDEGDTTDSAEEEDEMLRVRAFQRPGSVIPVDIMKIVLSLRKQRNRGMVQTEDQYKFIYRTVIDELVQQRIKVGENVLQFMKDAANDFTDSTPMSSKRRSSKRRSQPRSPRSTSISLGSSVSIGASGLTKLSSSTISYSASSYSDEDDSPKKTRELRASGDSNGPVLSLEHPSALPVIQPHSNKRKLAMSSADIKPLNDSGLSVDTSGPLLSHSSSQLSAHPQQHHHHHLHTHLHHGLSISPTQLEEHEMNGSLRDF